MKKILCIILVLCMALPFAACGKSNAGSAAVANPVHECTKDELMEKVGIPMGIPDGAENVRYSYIDGEETIAQIDFKYNGKEYCFRAKATGEIIQMGVSDENADIEQLQDAISKSVQAGASLAGYYESWDVVGEADVSYCDAVYAKGGKSGFITWFDVVPGILYSLSMEKCKSYEDLVSVAELCFIPAQGDS